MDHQLYTELQKVRDDIKRQREWLHNAKICYDDMDEVDVKTLDDIALTQDFIDYLIAREKKLLEKIC